MRSVIRYILANTPNQIIRLAVHNAVQAGLCLPVVTNQTARFSRLMTHLQTRQMELLYNMYVNIRHQLHVRKHTASITDKFRKLYQIMI